MRRFFGVLVRVLVLLVVGMVSLLTAMRFAIHGREVQVPKLVGMMPADAERVANASGLSLFRENRFYSNDVPEGRIVSQLPPEGASVRSGWRVRVAESLGPQRIAIPSVIGQSPRAAEINVRRRGLELNGMASAVLPGVLPDQVIAQSPPPNTQGVSSPKVGVLVSAAEEDKALVMPDLSGLPLAQASLAITDVGLKLGNVTTVKVEQDPNVISATAAPMRVPSEATILRHFPPAGQKVSPGMTVSFEVLR